MISRPWRTSWHALAPRLTAGVALVAYLVAVVGVPLPALPVSHTGPAFPCQGHLCGCRSAEECWRHCCCFTPEERWAWAREHHVQLPPYAEIPGHADAHPDECSAEPAGCPHCAHAARGCCHHAPDHDPAPPARPGWRWASGLEALHCHGIATLWVTTGAAVPPDRPLVWQPFPVPGGWLTCRADLTLVVPAVPPLPPPRPPAA